MAVLKRLSHDLLAALLGDPVLDFGSRFSASCTGVGQPVAMLRLIPILTSGRIVTAHQNRNRVTCKTESLFLSCLVPIGVTRGLQVALAGFKLLLARSRYSL